MEKKSEKHKKMEPSHDRAVCPVLHPSGGGRALFDLDNPAAEFPAMGQSAGPAMFRPSPQPLGSGGKLSGSDGGRFG